MHALFLFPHPDKMSSQQLSGRTTQGAIYYEVPENAQTIELEYDINYFSSNKIIFMGK